VLLKTSASLLWVILQVYGTNLQMWNRTGLSLGRNLNAFTLSLKSSVIKFLLVFSLTSTHVASYMCVFTSSEIKHKQIMKMCSREQNTQNFFIKTKRKRSISYDEDGK
jgi:hypothetical protein